jgi:5,10-methylenetetrahydromethanopterin reductase
MTALTEAVAIIRTLLSGATLNFEGEVFNYRGVSLKLRPVQSRIPIYIGAKSGPRSFEVAGEIGDGAILTDVYSPEWARVAMRGIRQGFRQGKRTREEKRRYEVASWTLVGIHRDGRVAREIVRPIVCFYLPTHFKRQLEICGVDLEVQQQIAKDLAAGRYDQAIERTTDDIVDKLSITGTPDEVTERLARVSKEGIDHFVVAPADNLTLENLGLGKYRVKSALDTKSALRLLEHEVMERLT